MYHHQPEHHSPSPYLSRSSNFLLTFCGPTFSQPFTLGGLPTLLHLSSSPILIAVNPFICISPQSCYQVFTIGSIWCSSCSCFLTSFIAEWKLSGGNFDALEIKGTQSHHGTATQMTPHIHTSDCHHVGESFIPFYRHATSADIIKRPRHHHDQDLAWWKWNCEVASPQWILLIVFVFIQYVQTMVVIVMPFGPHSFLNRQKYSFKMEPMATS